MRAHCCTRFASGKTLGIRARETLPSASGVRPLSKVVQNRRIDRFHHLLHRVGTSVIRLTSNEKVIGEFVLFIYASASALVRDQWRSMRRLHCNGCTHSTACTAEAAATHSQHLLTARLVDEPAKKQSTKEKTGPLWKKFGEAGVIAYVGINVFWYAIGVNLFLARGRRMPIKQGGARNSRVQAVPRRVGSVCRGVTAP